MVVYLQLQSLLRSRPPESEIEIEFRRTCRHLELTWRWPGPKFDNFPPPLLSALPNKPKSLEVEKSKGLRVLVTN